MDGCVSEHRYKTSMRWMPDSAVEREVEQGANRSAELTAKAFHIEDNAFLPLRRPQLSVRCLTTKTNGGGEPSAKEDFGN
jgi:hypothetical protein